MHRQEKYSCNTIAQLSKVYVCETINNESECEMRSMVELVQCCFLPMELLQSLINFVELQAQSI